MLQRKLGLYTINNMKTYILQCSKCGEEVDRCYKIKKPVCIKCKKKRKVKVRKDWYEASPIKKFHSQHIEVDRMLVYFGKKTYINKKNI